MSSNEEIISANKDITNKKDMSNKDLWNISFSKETPSENSEETSSENSGSDILIPREIRPKEIRPKEIFSEILEKDMIVSSHSIYHCHTTLNCNVIEYTWSISNIWMKFKSFPNIIIYEIENQPFNITASFNRENNTVAFNSFFSSTQKGFNIIYTSYVQTIEGPKLILYRRHVYLKHNMFIQSVDLKGISRDLYTPDNTLTVYFKFEVLETLHNTIHENILPSRMSMLNNTVFLNESLVTFVIEGKHLVINKSLLCSKSNVFEAMVNSLLKEEMSNVKIELEISDITYDVLKCLLLYVETGSLVLDDLKMRVDDSADTVSRKLYSLIEAANKYNIKDLLLSCEKLLIQNTSKFNVVEHLRFAHTNNANLLENYAIKFIKLYEYSIVKSANFKTLMKTYPNLLINIQEVELDTKKIYI